MFVMCVSLPLSRERLASIWDELTVVDELDSEDAERLALLTRPELGVTFSKIHAWRLTQYSKCVFLDADTLVLENVDDLFDREELSAAPDIGWPDCFNSGVFVFEPSLETYTNLLDMARQTGSFDGKLLSMYKYVLPPPYQYCKQGLRGWYVQASVELRPEDMSLLEKCPHFRGCYIQASMELGPEDVSLLEKCPHFRGCYVQALWRNVIPCTPVDFAYNCVEIDKYCDTFTVLNARWGPRSSEPLLGRLGYQRHKVPSSIHV